MTIKTSQPARLRGLDTLRALAILAATLYHLQSDLPEVLAPVAHFCWMGVDLFFVLSGYLVGAQALKTQEGGALHGLWRFYRRRLLRVLPPTWWCLVCMCWCRRGGSVRGFRRPGSS
jgi:peptidoglycan/LPS O-acetylase OafA/YrhL